jgi:hypothetical protein
MQAKQHTELTADSQPQPADPHDGANPTQGTANQALSIADQATAVNPTLAPANQAPTDGNQTPTTHPHTGEPHTPNFNDHQAPRRRRIGFFHFETILDPRTGRAVLAVVTSADPRISSSQPPKNPDAHCLKKL